MKKQILFNLLLIVSIVLSGTINASGQDPNVLDAAPTPLPMTTINCGNAAGPLNPSPGVTYFYTITTDVATVEAVHWFVTDDPQVISLVGTTPTLTADRDADGGLGDYILDAEDGVYNVGTNTEKSIDISWQYFDGASTAVLLVAYVKGAAGCSDNIEVWRIEPTILFALDLITVNQDGSLGTLAEPAEECVSPIQGAVYNGTELEMDYGSNYVYFLVTANNFTHSWLPDLDATTTGGGTITSVEWAYPANATVGTGWNDTSVPVLAQSSDGVVGSDGEAIVVRVLVTHGPVETPMGSTEATVQLSVDGHMYDAAAGVYTNDDLKDLEEIAGSCTQDHTDVTDYVLLPRPDIEEDASMGTNLFEPKN